MFSVPDDGPQLQLRTVSRVAGLLSLMLALPAYACGSGMGELAVLIGLIYLSPVVGSFLVFLFLLRTSAVRVVCASLASLSTVFALILGGVIFFSARSSGSELSESDVMLLVLWGLGAAGLIGSWYRFASRGASAPRLDGPVQPAQ
ncbi:hypothetical protein NVS55_37090 [Myxococcus stipitatus]|uniref:hypothetical protein n=1 Tax=Myxococcus stipitatus TaxID=83455 RepID=UPI00314563A7